jgi:hypothetical protein
VLPTGPGPWMDGRTYAQMDGWTGGHIRTDNWTDRRTDRRTDGLPVNRQTEGWSDGRMDGRTDSLTNGPSDIGGSHMKVIGIDVTVFSYAEKLTVCQYFGLH